MGQIIGGTAKPKRCNIQSISQLSTPAAGEYILVSSDNSMNAAGQGNFDSYIMGDGTTLAKDLEIKRIVDANTIKDLYVDTITYLDVTCTGWRMGIAINLLAGHTYTVTVTNGGNTLTYFKVYDAEDNVSEPFSWRNHIVDGSFSAEYTPSVDIVKVDFYSKTSGTCTITGINEDKILLSTEDVVNNLSSGGEEKPLSAEQGKVLNEEVSILRQYSIPLCHGKYANNRSATNSFTDARACFANNGFTTLRVKEGYHYTLYASDSVLYGSGTTTAIKNSYTTDSYKNTTSLAYFYISVKRIAGGDIKIDELSDLVTLEFDSSIYNFKTMNDVDNYYKFGKELDIEDYGYISGERIDPNNGIMSGNSYSRTEKIDVTDYDAIKMYCDSMWDETSFLYIVFGWYDESNVLFGTSRIQLRTRDRIVIAVVPENAKYVSVDTSNGRFNLIGMKHEKSAADAHYYNSGKSVISKLKDVSLIICSGQSLMVGADAQGMSYGETYFPLRQLNIVNSEIRNFAKLVNSQGNLGSEKPDRGMAEMFVEAVAKENGISVYANEWERHLLVFANVAIGGTTIEQLTNTYYDSVTSAITNTKTLCDKFGLTMAAPALVWFQGEQDIKEAMSSADYKTALIAYHNKVCNSLSTIAGITKRPKCCIYQPASQCLYSQTYNYANPYLEFNNAYVELLRDNNEFIACAPAYIFDGAPNTGGFVHLNARSYKTLGAYAGYSLKKSIIDGVDMKGVIPLTTTVSDTTITIKYNVPCPPLKFDTEWVKETPLVNGVHTYGFNVVKSDDTELITSVSVFDDTVTIECSESPIGAKLRYGLNGDRIHMANSAYWGIDGRIHGGRGNLRDSQGDYVQKEIRELGQTMRLDNWAYCFEKVLEEAG